jgi:hypothetical protein
MSLHRLSMLLTVFALALICTACQPKTPAGRAAEEKKPVVNGAASVENEKSVPQPAAKAKHKNVVAHQKPQSPSPPPAIPKVALSEALRATCLVFVGDAMPEAELRDLDGKPHALGSLYGQKLTVVCLWSIGTKPRSRLIAAAALQDLMREVAGPFGPKGVAVIAINIGDPPAAVKEQVAQTGATFPNLLDPKGEYMARIAKDKRVPRTFLLDAAGKVLWFDTEYSRPSRRDLIQGIRVALGEL